MLETNMPPNDNNDNQQNDWSRTGRRIGVQLAYPLEEKRLLKWRPPFIVQPKLDGERCRVLVNQDGTITLLSSEGNPIHSLPHITASLENIHRSLAGLELDGELYIHGSPLESIHSVISTRVGLHPLFEDVKLHVFDLVDEASPQALRTQRLEALRLTLPSDCVEVVPFKLADSFDQIMDCLEWSLEEGFEGVIVRNIEAPYLRRRSVWMMKFKPKKEDIYQILGFTQEISIHNQPKQAIGALICRAHEGEETFHVGTGFTREQRFDLWKQRYELQYKHVRVRYQHLTSARGVPRSSVFVEIL